MGISALALLVVAGEPSLRTVRAVRTDVPPTLDGKLDDACWRRAPVAGDFRRFNVGTPAAQAGEARTLYDDANLYVAFRCAEPRMDLVRRDVATNPSRFNYGHGNTVELFLDPGGSKRHYWQFMINTNGTTETHLATHDVLHLGDLAWRAKVFLGRDHFSAEVAIPFALMHLKPDAGRVWGVNFCRARQIGKQEAEYMYSSWQPMRGSFLRPELFGRLAIDADLSRFRYAVTAPEVIRSGEPSMVRVANLTGRPGRVKVHVALRGPGGVSRRHEATLSLGRDHAVRLRLGVFTDADVGAEIRITIRDARSGELLFVGATQTIDETP